LRTNNIVSFMVMLKFPKFKLLFFLVLFLPLFVISQTEITEDKLDEFMADVLMTNNILDKVAEFDTLYYSMKAEGYEGSYSSLLWEIFLTANQSGNSQFISNSLSILLYAHTGKRKFEEAIKYSDTILYGNFQINLTDSINLYNIRAISCSGLRLYEECLKNIMDRDELLDRLDIESKRTFYSKTHIRLGNLYYASGLYHEAIGETKKLIKEILINDSTANVATYYNNIALAWQNLNEPDSALIYFDAARQMILANTQKGDTFFLHMVIGNIGSVLMMKKEYDTAIPMLLQDLQSSKKQKTDEGYENVVSTQLLLAKCYLDLGNPSLAMSLLDSATTYINLTSSKISPLNFYQFKGDILHALGSYDSAYLYSKKYIAMVDSIQQIEKRESVISLQLTYDTKKKEHLIAKQKQQLANEWQKASIEKERAQKQKYMLYISLLLLAGVLSIMFYIIMSRIKQKQVNRLLEQKNEMISTQANDLEKLDKFKEAMTNMLAHDLKNPLNTITSISDDPGKLEQKQIKQAGEKMLTMVVNLLDISKYETSTMPLKLNNWHAKTLVENVIQRINLLAENKFITIQNQVTGNIYVSADNDILERVFENLLTNAIKYSPINGKIDIKAKVLSNGHVRFSILDQGEGIPEGHKEKLFDKYYQVDAMNSGKIRSTGLGLAFCKMAIEAHGGLIDVESLSGKGSEFWFTLEKGKKNQETETRVGTEQENMVQVYLNENEKKELQHRIKVLQQTAYYEFSKIRKTIASLENNPSENIKLWRKLLLRAVNSGNEDRYKELINLQTMYYDSV